MSDDIFDDMLGNNPQNHERPDDPKAQAMYPSLAEDKVLRRKHGGSAFYRMLEQMEIDGKLDTIRHDAVVNGDPDRVEEITRLQQQERAAHTRALLAYPSLAKFYED